MPIQLLVLFYLGVLPLYVRIVMRTAPTLMNFDVVILLAIIIHSSALVLMQPEYRQMNCDV